MPNTIDQYTYAEVFENGQKVRHTNEQCQVFEAEHYITVYDDSLQNLEQLKNRVEQLEEEIKETLEENNDQMNILHNLLKGEDQNDLEEIYPNSLEESTVEKYFEIREKKDQKENLLKQVERLEEQIENMKSAVDAISDEVKEKVRKEEE